MFSLHFLNIKIALIWRTVMMDLCNAPLRNTVGISLAHKIVKFSTHEICGIM